MDSLHFSELHPFEGSDIRRDRLSELPDSLILAILSFLEMRDVAATTLLSKRWKNLWTTVPCLRFSNYSRDFDTLRSFIYKALALWKGDKILKFCIDGVFDASLATDLDSWLLFAIERQVDELYINFINWILGLPAQQVLEYYAPQSLLSCQSITKLSLISCKLEIKENVKWNILKSLTMECVYFLSEDAMDSILSGSPQLEVLNLSNFDGFHHLNIRSNSLKMLKIDRYGFGLIFGQVKVDKMLSIWAPNLEILEFSDASFAKCSMHVPSLTTAILDFRHQENFGNEVFSPHDETVRQVILGVSHAEKVTLSVWSTKVFLEMRVEGVLLPFSNAKYLKLKASTASEILAVLEFFPQLELLIVEFVSLITFIDSLMGVEQCFDSGSAEPTTLLPSPSFLHLRTIEISWHARDASIFPSIELMLRDSPLLQKLVFRPKWSGDNPDMLLLAEDKLMSMPRSSPTAEVIIIQDFD